MIRVFASSIVLAAALCGPAQGQDPFAVARLNAPSGPPVLHHPVGAPLVALRLSAPIPEDLPEGAVELLQELARPAATAAADRVGGALAMRRTAGHAVISVTGPAAELDTLVAILRQATGEPEVSVDRLQRARARAGDRVLESLDRPEPLLRRRLWSALQGTSSVTNSGAAVMDADAIRHAGARLYDPARLRVVVVGPAAPAMLRSAFGAWPAPRSQPGPGSAVDPAPRPSRVPPLLDWSAEAVRIDAAPAPLAVAARLVDRRARAEDLPHAGVEAWHAPEVAAIVWIGARGLGESRAAGSEGGRPPSKSRIARLVGEVLATERLDAAVQVAAGSLRRGLLLEARSPAGRAEVIGRLADLLNRPDGAERLLDGLAGVRPRDVRRVLESALNAPAIRVAP